MANIGNVVVTLKASTAQFRTAMKASQGTVSKLRTGVGALTAVLGAGGLALMLRRATDASVDFEAEMTKIVTLVGVADSQMKEWTGSIRTLSQRVGRGPRELARALFVVTSAGERR